MSNFVFSPSEAKFFASAWKQDYINGGVWPNDAESISDDLYHKFSCTPPPGKCVITVNNLPAWGDLPPPTSEELIDMAFSEKAGRIMEANAYMNSKQWPGKAAIGRLKGEGLTQYNLWLDYLDALEAVDTSSAPDIEWPTPPGEQAS
ncbi:tail fiber assembly protein [Citrobacter freundii]|uniref:tail fiber assembly protein n=1 Tax=Citrobacter freundii TaxID=546 RepID=UPI0013D466D2|nr:tail fiber assembly protein [Citrobacter freundii]